MSEALVILGLGGALRRHSVARRALHETLAAIPPPTETVDLALTSHPLPLYDDDIDAFTPTVQALRAAAQRADGFVIATPEYHNGIAGVVKNAIDWLKPSMVRDKPVAIIAVGGGTASGHRALTQMRQVVRGLGGFAIPGEVAIGNSDAVTPGAPWPDPATERHIQRLAADIVRYAAHFRALRAG